MRLVYSGVVLAALAFNAWAATLLEYKDVRVSTEDVKAKTAYLEKGQQQSLLARRDSVEKIVEGILYDTVAAKNVDQEVYESENYERFLHNVCQKYGMEITLENRKGVIDRFKEHGLERSFYLEEANWKAKYWLEKEINSKSKVPFEKMAREKYLVSGGLPDEWENVKSKWVKQVKNNYLRRVRLEIWSNLVDRGKIKTYPDNFEAFLQQHAPKPSAVEGPLSQKP